jgi:EAL domain-containing protein (putative c-di-GMP-specific phosphodiesterase class I)
MKRVRNRSRTRAEAAWVSFATCWAQAEAGRIISPDNFIVAAERYNITPNIDRWVIENAFRWLVS